MASHFHHVGIQLFVNETGQNLYIWKEEILNKPYKLFEIFFRVKLSVLIEKNSGLWKQVWISEKNKWQIKNQDKKMVPHRIMQFFAY